MHWTIWLSAFLKKIILIIFPKSKHLDTFYNYYSFYNYLFISLLNPFWLFATPWTAAHQASLSITNSQSLLKLMSIKLVSPSNHLIHCCPLSCLQSFPASGSFPIIQFFTSSGQSIGAWALTSVLPMNIQGWLPLGLTSLIFLYKGFSSLL